MDTWNSDRIYNWYGMALANESSRWEFYFDSSDNTFFDLQLKDNHYTIEDKPRLSASEKKLLLSKIEKIKNNDASLIEIKKSEKPLRHLFDQTTSYENYMKREEEWNFVNEKIKTFFNTYSIPVEARLIE